MSKLTVFLQDRLSNSPNSTNWVTMVTSPTKIAFEMAALIEKNGQPVQVVDDNYLEHMNTKQVADGILSLVEHNMTVIFTTENQQILLNLIPLIEHFKRKNPDPQSTGKFCLHLYGEQAEYAPELRNFVDFHFRASASDLME